MSEGFIIAIAIIGAVVVWVLSFIGVRLQRLTLSQPTEEPRPAGALIRLTARVIDQLPISIISIIIGVVVTLLDALGAPKIALWTSAFASYILLSLLYFAITTSRSGQPLGKKLTGVSVQTVEGRKVGFGQSFVREFTRMVFAGLTQFIVGHINWITLGATKQKTALHDLISGIRVRTTSRPNSYVVPAAVVGWVLPFIVVFGVLRPFLMQAFFLPSLSMSPTMPTNSHFLSNKLAYKIGAVKRGDVVVFNTPDKAEWHTASNTKLVKRVVALPGDRVLVRADALFVNDRKIGSYLLPDDISFYLYKSNKLFTVPEGECFVLGDNINNSYDSRFCGTIPLKNVTGKVSLIFWPLNCAGEVK